MSGLSRFLKQNKIKRENIKHPVTASIVDENGKPVLWELRPLSTDEVERIRDNCTMEVQVPGKPHVYRPKTDMSRYQLEMVCAAVVEPDLHNKELQDSYGVMTPEELLTQLVDNPGEYADLMAVTQKLNGFKTLQEEVNEAKNS